MADICSKEDFENALEEVIDLFDHPPSPGSAGEGRFAALLDQVIRFRDSAPAEEVAPLTQAPGLEARLRRLQELHAKPDPNGIGPTLGMDVSHS
jgi:hypothetical protein